MRDQIIEANPLPVFLLERGYEVKPKGSNYVSNGCPLKHHRPGHHCVSVDTAKRVWHCNSCDVGGSVVDWLMHNQGVNAAQALRLLGRQQKRPAKPSQSPPPLSNNGPSQNGGFDWQRYVNAFELRDLMRLGNERWYSRSFCSWLHGKKLVGLYNGNFAFPVLDATGNMVGAHVKPSSGADWFYAPTGTKTTPFIIGALATAKQVHLGESQWDVLALADRSDLYRESSVAFVATRGSGNARLARSLLSTC